MPALLGNNCSLNIRFLCWTWPSVALSASRLELCTMEDVLTSFVKHHAFPTVLVQLCVNWSSSMFKHPIVSWRSHGSVLAELCAMPDRLTYLPAKVTHITHHTLCNLRTTTGYISSSLMSRFSLCNACLHHAGHQKVKTIGTMLSDDTIQFGAMHNSAMFLNRCFGSKRASSSPLFLLSSLNFTPFLHLTAMPFQKIHHPLISSFSFWMKSDRWGWWRALGLNGFPWVSLVASLQFLSFEHQTRDHPYRPWFTSPRKTSHKLTTVGKRNLLLEVALMCWQRRYTLSLRD